MTLIAVSALLLAAYLAIRATSRGFATFGTGLLLKGSAVLGAFGGPPSTDPAERRAASAGQTSLVEFPVDPGDGVAREDLELDFGDRSIPARLYRPSGGGSAAIVILYHGGGFVLGNLDTYEPLARALCRACGAAVLAPDYRLAPEHRFPAAAEDALETYRWVLAARRDGRLPDAPIFAAGDSAGGNLAAVACRAARDAGLPVPAGQVLLYPVVDLSRMDTPSYRAFARGFVLTKADMEWFRACYLRDAEDAADPRASPLLAKDLSGLPPALVLTAGFDVLRDEGEAYAAALRSAGVEVRSRRFGGHIHGFVQMGRFVGGARRAVDLAAEFVEERAAILRAPSSS